MNILFLEPEFDDWVEVITNLKIPIIKDMTTIQNYDNPIVIPLKYSQVKHITSSPNYLCPTYSTIQILNDKIKFHKFMTQNKFHHLIPITYKINKNHLSPIKYPCIFKLGITYGAHGSHICDNEFQLKNYELKNSHYFVQEFILGSVEYTAHLFILNGVIKWGVCYYMGQPKKYYIQKGRMEKYKKLANFDWNLFNGIFKVLSYTGFACVDFKMVNSNIKIFEINPRLGGTIVHDPDDFPNLIEFIRNQVY